MKLSELKVGERFMFARKENTLPGVFTKLSDSALCKFGDETGGGYASGFFDVIKVND